jgi:hypothetical protein
MVRDREKLSSVLVSAPQKSINVAKMFKTFSTTVKMQACVIIMCGHSVSVYSCTKGITPVESYVLLLLFIYFSFCITDNIFKINTIN